VGEKRRTWIVNAGLRFYSILLQGCSGGIAVLSDTQVEASGTPPVQPESSRFLPNRLLYTLYALALGVSVSIWFLAIRAPLWLDETVSFFTIKGGVAQMLSRQGWPGVPAYPFLLWLWTKAMGTGEITLRMLSVLAMLGAAYLLYRAARELFDRDVAIIAAVVFCLHPVVVFESIDIRPYAFAALAITSSIFLLLRLRHNNAPSLAALFGFSAACIVYFQFLFVVILPALALCLFSLPTGDRKTYWRRIGIALGTFALAFLPVLPGLRYMFHTSGTHVFSEVPKLSYLGQVFAQKRMLYPFAAIVLLAAATRRLNLRSSLELWPVLLCTSLALIPALILYGVSVETSIHIFVFRYRLVAVPGVALCWALAVSRIDPRGLRLLFCAVIVAITAFIYVKSPASRTHDYTWKYALDAVEKNASADGAPVVICSDLPESDYLPIPSGAAAKDSAIFAPLSYYQLTVPVVTLPRALNDRAKQAGSQFLKEAAQRHQRFLAVGFMASWETLDWLVDATDDVYSARELGTFNGIRVLEFTPVAPPVPPPVPALDRSR
jgi:4-amino-4-deoxy-L-arabinose transferase-like glycosyltransferase